MINLFSIQIENYNSNRWSSSIKCNLIYWHKKKLPILYLCGGKKIRYADEKNTLGIKFK